MEGNRRVITLRRLGMENKVVIEIEHINKKFGSQVALDDISLSCESGKIYGFIGYNGSGKTVLFKCICGLMSVDSGSIRVSGKKIGKEMIQDAGIIIENPAFLSNKSGKKNLELLYMLNHGRNNKRICEVMKKVGLDYKSRKKVKNYSLGMRQRLAIGQAIMENPQVLILDEPMNGLDIDGIQEVRKILLELKKQNKVILLASHNREDIEVLCDEVYEMNHGHMELYKK